ncbi:MAG: hypothetical protein JWO94_1075 [Verrucomicrobiaceae bacterium]|nr:hypothetical protein [Verrucomicrobiaceae bacterium]
MNTKLCLLCLGLALASTASATAQVVPTTPTHFAKRNIGSSSVTSGVVSDNGSGSTSTGISQAKAGPTVRTTTYLVLSGARQWTSSDGKPLLAKLIAFEDITTEAPAGSSATPAPPAIPGKPTVQRDGKVRLLVDRMVYEVALDKLSSADQEFVSTTTRAVKATK